MAGQIKKSAFLFILLVVVLFLASCSKKNDLENEIPEKIRQWALSAKASSSYAGKYGAQRDDYSPFAATGSPDVEECEDSPKAWTPKEENKGMQWLELSYDELVYPSGIRVRESYNPGAIVKIELQNYFDKTYYTAWEGSDNRRKKPCPGFFEKNFTFEDKNVSYEMLPFQTDTVRITLDTDTPGWNEIDAVELIGYEKKWHLFNSTLVIEEP